MSRCGPCSPDRHAPRQGGVGGGIAPHHRLGGCGVDAERGGIDGVGLDRPVAHVDDGRGRGRWSARRARRRRGRSSPARRRGEPARRPCGSAIAGVAHADQEPAHPGRVGQRPEDVEDGGHAQLAAGRAGVAHGGVEARARSRTRCPPRATQRADVLGPTSMATPERLEQSAEPHGDDAARLPCLHTRPPGTGDHDGRQRRDVDRVAAVAAGADDVDHGVAGRQRRPARRPPSMASSRPVSSSMVSPFMRRATMNPAIWAGVAAPSRISAIAARARSGVRSAPDESVPMTAAHPSNVIGPLGRPAALADDAPALALGGPAPDAFLLRAPRARVRGRSHGRDSRRTPPSHRRPRRR